MTFTVATWREFKDAARQAFAGDVIRFVGRGPIQANGSVTLRAGVTIDARGGAATDLNRP